MYFDKNAQALLQADPAHESLLSRVRQTPTIPEESLVLFQTEDGHYTLQYGELLLHDANSPIQEARKAFKASCKSGEDRLHLILGLGLGYALDETFQTSPGQIIVYEPDEALLQFILENVDLSEQFASGRVRLASTQFDLLTFMRPKIYSDYELDILCLNSSSTRLGAEIPVLVQKFKAMITDWARDYRTVNRFHLLWMEQFFANFPYFAETDTIESLFNRFEGKPALVISRGPSLDGAIESIKELQNACVLIAVGSAVRRLYENGIIPDFAVYYDANGMQEQLNGISAEYLRKVTFILCPSSQRCCYEAPSRGKMVFFSQNGKQMCDWMDLTLNKKHLRLEGGGTVSLIALQLALAMGCGPIMLVGQDLAFPNNQVYAGGIPLQQDEQGNMLLSRSETLYAEPEAMTMVEGQNGEMLPALSAYAGFIRHFESLAAKVASDPRPVTLYNTSIGGAKIDGFILKPLSEFKGRFTPWKSPFALAEAPILTTAQVTERRDQLRQALRTLKADFGEIIAFCDTIRFSLPAEDSEPNHLETTIWESTQRLFRLVQSKPFVGFLIMFELIPYKQRFKAFANAETFDPSIRQDFVNALERSSRLLQEKFLPWVEQTEHRLERMTTSVAVGEPNARETAPDGTQGAVAAG